MSISANCFKLDTFKSMRSEICGLDEQKTVFIPKFLPNCISEILSPTIIDLLKSMDGKSFFAAIAIPGAGLRQEQPMAER